MNYKKILDTVFKENFGRDLSFNDYNLNIFLKSLDIGFIKEFYVSEYTNINEFSDAMDEAQKELKQQGYFAEQTDNKIIAVTGIEGMIILKYVDSAYAQCFERYLK